MGVLTTVQFVDSDSRELRARRHRALGDPLRLAIVDDLATSDRTPAELCRIVGIESNLLAHHLDVLESVGMITRSASRGDRRRRYVRLVHDDTTGLVTRRVSRPGRALFVCTHNSARSQLAAALWTQLAGAAAQSAGTEPAGRVHPGAIAAARRAGLDLTDATPRALDSVLNRSTAPRRGIVVTVCDQAHEALTIGDSWMHWSITDPVPAATAKAFDATVAELRRRITTFIGGVHDA